MVLGISASFFENNGHRRTNTEIALNRKLGIVDSADVLYDSKTKSGATDTLGMGFIHAVEAFAQARQVFFFDTDARVLDLEDHVLGGFFDGHGNVSAVLVVTVPWKQDLFGRIWLPISSESATIAPTLPLVSSTSASIR